MSDMHSTTPLGSLSPISARDRAGSEKSITPHKARSKSPPRTTPNLDSSLDKSLESERKPLNLNLGRSSGIGESADDERSTISSPAYTEQWEDYSSPRKSVLHSQITYRSKESGRLSPPMETANVEVGHQPLTLPRFNERLKLKKGRQFVDFQTPAPTVVYVPHRSFAHGNFTNVTVQRKNGRYVVIEQRPVHTKFTDMSPEMQQAYQKELFGPDSAWLKKKTPWSWSTKGNFIDRSVNKGFAEPYLPPMKSRYSHVESKVGSMDNMEHHAGGGLHKIPSFKLKWNAEAKVGSLPNTFRENYSPQDSGSLKLPGITPRFGASAASGSFTSIHYTPGGNVILRRPKYNAKSVVGSLDNVSHTPSGGDVNIPRNQIRWKKESKVGSLDNIAHLPKNSNVQVFNEKLDWKTTSKIGSMDNVDHNPNRRRFKVPHFGRDWNKKAAPKVKSLANTHHTPGGGNVQIIDQKLNWKAKPKIESHWKFNYDYKSLFEDDDYDVSNFSQTGSQPFTV